MWRIPVRLVSAVTCASTAGSLIVRRQLIIGRTRGAVVGAFLEAIHARIVHFQQQYVGTLILLLLDPAEIGNLVDARMLFVLPPLVAAVISLLLPLCPVRIQDLPGQDHPADCGHLLIAVRQYCSKACSNAARALAGRAKQANQRSDHSVLTGSRFGTRMDTDV
jgi:hypothetical protein